MSTPLNLDSLLNQINGGQAAEVLPQLEALHARLPGNPAVLTLRAEALRHSGRHGEAIAAYQEAGRHGAGARNWLAAGVLLAAERATDQSVDCLRKALAEAPDSDEILDALITTLFNGGRHKDGIEYARRQLIVSRNPTFMSRAALLLQSNDLYEESAEAFKHIVALAPNDPAIIGAALVPTRYTCDWEWIESLQAKIRACYERGDCSAPQEFPLTNITWCADEAVNLSVTRAYVARMVPRAQLLAPEPPPPVGRRIRVGYLSGDFRNHATMHLMAGIFEQHDRSQFEVFAYDYTTPDISEYRQRFLDAVEHHVPVHSMSDAQTAARIAADRLDILFDLKLYTGGGRAGIMAYRPARLQAAYIGFPGSAASPDIDYVICDRFVTPDKSAPYWTEKFCRLPHSYQCNDRKRAAAADPGGRAKHGLPEDRIVFGAFNQSYKIDRSSFAVWMRILQEVPDSVLWLLGQSEAARSNLSRHAQLTGIDPQRLIFAQFADPREHLARLQLADAVLDALICNGHTTTSDALWAAVPVITARGRHFASRVSESLLNAMELPELVANDPDDMVRIARRIGTDAAYRKSLREKVAANRLVAPLFDTARFTRDFESAIQMMVERHRAGLPAEHMDVVDKGPVGPVSERPGFVGRVSALQTAYQGCPLCAGQGVSMGFGNITQHPLWHEPLPPNIEWLRCAKCAHIHTRHYWSEAGRAELLRNADAERVELAPQALATRRESWIALIEKVTGLLGGYQAALCREQKPVWVDVGCGDGSLLMTVLDHGYSAVGLDTHAAAAERIRKLGFSALANDFLTLEFQITPDVLTLLNVLPQMSDPRAALRKAAQVLRPGGVVVVSATDASSSAWRVREASNANTSWLDPERHHVLTRQHIITLLNECGFEISGVSPSRHPGSDVEIYAIRAATGSAAPLRSKPGPATPAQPYHVLQVRPTGYVHADALTELAESVYYGLRRLGLPVTYHEPPLASSRTVIFGAHLLDADSARAVPADAVIFNSEQIDADSPWLSGPYMEVLRTHHVWDYSAENVQRLRQRGVHNVQHVPLGYLPELSRIAPAVEDIDVLFYGSINPRRQFILEALQRRGLKVTALTGCYGEARDRLIARSKVVLNLHYYESKVFEIVRVSYLLSNFKAVVAECDAGTSIEPDLLEALRTAPYDGLVDACVELVQDDAGRRALAQRGYELFAARPTESVLATALGIRQPSAADPAQSAGGASPRTLQIDSGNDFLNLDSNDYFDCIIAKNVLQQVPDLVGAMTHCLRLLRPGGRLEISVPYDLSLAAWQDPANVRAFNQHSWLYFTDWHWQLGWIDMRFELASLTYIPSPLGAELVASGAPQEQILRTPRAIDSMQVVLRKRYLQESERREARARQSRKEPRQGV